MRLLITNILLIVNLNVLYSQSNCDTLDFLDCGKNEITVMDSGKLSRMVEQFQAFSSEKSEPIQIVHIGDSHLQAGFITEKIKQKLFQSYNTDSFASPGFIFPYTIAQTNNPFFYQVDYTGHWDWSKNVDANRACSLGLSGITVRTIDSIVSIQIKMQNNDENNPVKYRFNKIKIFHSSGNINIAVNNLIAETNEGVSTILLDQLDDSISIQIQKPSAEKYFELYGIILENSNSNINYHTIGVNGATALSYLKCDYLSNHLKEISPDIILLSLGTNEAFDKDYDLIEHEYILKDLILQIRDLAPNSLILCTTPNDHFKDGKPNENVRLAQQNILKICHEFKLSYWDFYSIMGSEGSIEKWYARGITGNDKIHFNKKGYEIQGELFAKAFFELINKY